MSMPNRYYDVVVLGRSLGALVAAALLARRDFTVLVVGQGQQPTDYTYEEYALRRRPFSMLAGSSPVWRRVLGELAYTQGWRRVVQTVRPRLSILSPGRRFAIDDDAELFGREVHREFPEVRRLVAELYAELARVTEAADGAFDRDVLWPPGTFLERRQTGRAASALPYAKAEPHADLLADFPRNHFYRRIMTESVRIATDLAAVPPAFAAARLHGAWASGPVGLPGGGQQLEDLLLARIEAQGGKQVMSDRAVFLDVKRGSVGAVQLDSAAAPVGAGFVIADMTGEELAALAGGEGISKRAQREWPRVTALVGRFVTCIVAKLEGLPEPLGGEALLLPEEGNDRDSAIHLQTSRLDGYAILVAEMLVRDTGALPLRQARAHILERVCAELPFLERHLRVVDSVHDGLPLWRYDRTRREEIDRAAAGLDARPEPLERQLEVDPPGYLGLGGEPIRGPIDRTLLVGPSVLPALGQEGRLLAACGAARIVTQSDKRKARMRREMWTKIEIS
ncbi:hypothetical protein JYT22_00415 [Endomicrobium sp. AH-315-J14]|nr:hypothetical protein [Endomicrobium sp. AH-315-J14]